MGLGIGDEIGDGGGGRAVVRNGRVRVVRRKVVVGRCILLLVAGFTSLSLR